MSEPSPAADAAEYLRGRVLVLLSGAFLSVGGPLIRLLDEATEWQFLLYRAVVVMAAVTALVAARSRGALLSAFRLAGAGAVGAGACLGVAFTGFVFSITHTTVANTLFLLAAAPFFSALLARAMLGERVARNTWIAMGGAAVGIAVMVGDGLSRGNAFGDLTALAAAIGFAGFSVLLRRGREVDMAPAVWFGGAFSGVSALVACAVTGAGVAISIADAALAAIYGVVGIGAGLFLFTLGSRHVPAAELTLLSLTEIVLGPLWVWLAFDELPSRATLVGGAVLLGSLVFLATAGGRRRAPARPR